MTIASSLSAETELNATPHRRATVVLWSDADLHQSSTDFGTAAWSAYAGRVHNSGYYFSVDELIAACILLNVNVLVFKQLDTVLVNAGGYFGGQGEPVCCNLASKRECEARAHFESLVGERQLIDFMCSFSFKRRRLRKKSLRPCNGVSAICRHMMATLTRWDMVQLQGCRFETSLDFDAVVVFLGLLLMAFSWICQG